MVARCIGRTGWRIYVGGVFTRGFILKEVYTWPQVDLYVGIRLGRRLGWRPLGAILGGFWEAKIRPKTFQDGARTGQDGAKTAPDGQKSPQDALKMR